VQVTPNAKKNEVIGVLDDALKIKLHAQPVEGKANEALVRYFAEVLGVAKSSIKVAHGHTSKRKILEIRDTQLTEEIAMKAFQQTEKLP
jgi:hypothetical protein